MGARVKEMRPTRVARLMAWDEVMAVTTDQGSMRYVNQFVVMSAIAGLERSKESR
jgi:hypothetical protein